jgi:superfamily I DNA/RNA helicase
LFLKIFLKKRGADEEDEYRIEEWRRAFYVAATRAKFNMYFYYVNGLTYFQRTRYFDNIDTKYYIFTKNADTVKIREPKKPRNPPNITH